MEKMEMVKKVMQKFMVPELEIIKEENLEIKTILGMMSKRLDDINAHLVDQSRRMDETNKRMDNLRVELRDEMVGLREELKEEIAKTNKRIDESRVELKSEIFQNTLRIDDNNKRIDKTNDKIDDLRVELRSEIAKNNMRIDSLYLAIVRREEHEKLEIRTGRLEQDMVQTKSVIQEKMAA